MFGKYKGATGRDWVLEVGLYTGPHGGDPRLRYLVYPYWSDDMRPIHAGFARVDVVIKRNTTVASINVIIADARDTTRSWIDTGVGIDLKKDVPPDADVWRKDVFQMLPVVTTDYDVSSIVMWHATRYFSFLIQFGWAEDVKALAAGFSVPPGTNLAGANRLASQRLYALARE